MLNKFRPFIIYQNTFGKFLPSLIFNKNKYHLSILFNSSMFYELKSKSFQFNKIVRYSHLLGPRFKSIGITFNQVDNYLCFYLTIEQRTFINWLKLQLGLKKAHYTDFKNYLLAIIYKKEFNYELYHYTVEDNILIEAEEQIKDLVNRVNVIHFSKQFNPSYYKGIYSQKDINIQFFRLLSVWINLEKFNLTNKLILRFYPRFGGKEKAPHDIKILFTEFSN